MSDSSKSNPAGTEWTVRSRYVTTDGDQVTYLYLHDSQSTDNDRFAVLYSYAWPTTPQFIQYETRTDAVTAYVRSLNSAERRGIVAHKEG